MRFSGLTPFARARLRQRDPPGAYSYLQEFGRPLEAIRLVKDVIRRARTMGALARPPSPRAQPVPPAGPFLDTLSLPTTPDPAAEGLLVQALERLTPPRIRWLETTLWLRVRLPGLGYEAHGRHLTGPNN